MGHGGMLKPHFFDRLKIDKVVTNLISNAMKFTPPGGKITMRAWNEGDVLKFSVEDTGIGIAPDKLPHIFERFMQVDASSTRAYGGMGIGLSLVKDFVELHGGSVAVESAPGKGTRFVVSLPQGQEYFKAPVVTEEIHEIGRGIELPVATIIETLRETHSPDEIASFNERTATHAETVLIVDDNPDMRLAITWILEDRYDILMARDGEEGENLARERKPHLIVSDIMMPKKDGYHLTRDLKGDPETRDIPIILLTAKSGEDSLVQGFDAGADDYISKPFLPREVVSRVRNLIRIRQQQKEIERQAGDLMNIASQVAHDIRSPLSSIKAILEHLKEEPEELGRRSDYLNLLELSARRLNGIAEDLLKNQDGSAGGEKKSWLVFSIPKVLDELAGEFSSLRKKPWLTVHKDFNHSLYSVGNRERVQRALGNILKNAAEAVSEHTAGEIRIRTWINDGRGHIAVRDNGRGMTRETLSRVLQGGFSSGKTGGHGIGMKIVNEVVREHDWTLAAESIPGEGTTFTFSFVLPDSETLNELPREEGCGTFDLKVHPNEPVIVIDDDPAMRLQWELIAAKKKFPIRSYESYEEFKKKNPDGAGSRSAIVDYHFANSELNGIEIIQKLRLQNFDNISLCTAEYWKPLVQKQARELNVAVCPKPIPRIRIKGLYGAPGSYTNAQYRVLVIDDDPLIGLTWQTLKDRLKIKELHYFPRLEAFLESKIDPAVFDISFVDLHLENTRYNGPAVANYLKDNRARRVVIASGQKSTPRVVTKADDFSDEKIPDSLEKFLA